MLHHGDNLAIMQGMEAGSVDLIYADPPFGTGKDWGAFVDKRTGDEYLTWIKPRLIEMQRLLTPAGSIYLHCDPTMSHYLKVLMDSVFGRDNFRNEIVWAYQRWTGATKYFQRMHDILLMYARSGKARFNQLFEPHSEKGQRRHKGQNRVTRVVADGSLQQTYVASHGVKAMRDVWELSYLNANAYERTGYPTQKPLALLSRIVVASSNPGDVVLDPFCGSGTALVAAVRAGRRWIGIDTNADAIRITSERTDATALRAAQARAGKVIGSPHGTSDARYHR